MTVDAFTVSWQYTFFYAFPPFSLILICLGKIINDKTTRILVFPYWSGQAWFPLLTRILISDIVIFKPNRDVLRSRYSLYEIKHPKHSLRPNAIFHLGKYNETVFHFI